VVAHRGHPSARALTIGAGAGACLLVALADPAEAGFYPPCPFHAVTGLWCPGCGGLRAAHQLLTGHPAAALALNPLLVLSLPLLLWALAATVGHRARGPSLPGWATWAGAGVVAVFWVLRNVPVDPFTALAP
jgi:hypothetical protein